MRTRLDELLEHHLSEWRCSELQADAKKLAEACFRHGVERGAGDLKLWGYLSGAVQQMIDTTVPAPAKEKAGPKEKAGLRYCYGFNIDRRKGERRKGTEVVGDDGQFTIYGRRYIVSGRLIREEDRRTGKERRKP